MSKKSIGKKLFTVALIGAAIGGAVAFFKKFENEHDDDFSGVDPVDSDSGEDCDDCASPDITRSYTTIASEKPEDTAAKEETAEAVSENVES